MVRDTENDMPTTRGSAVKPKSTEAVDHASVKAQDMPCTEDDHVKHHMAFAETQTNETHTDFEHAEKQPDFATQSCEVVVGESDMRVKGLVEGTEVE